MTWWIIASVVVAIAWTVACYIISVKTTGRPPGDLYDALRDITRRDKP